MATTATAPENNILIVEDNLLDYENLSREINKMLDPKPRITHRENLNQALNQDYPIPDMVLLDLTLEDSDGLETYIELRQKFPYLPIFIISGLEDKKIIEGALSLGANAFFVKGQIDFSKLKNFISNSIFADDSSVQKELAPSAFNELNEILPLGIFQWDIKTNKIEVQKGWEKIFSSPESGRPRSVYEWAKKIVLDDRRLFLRKLGIFFQSKESQFSMEFRMMDHSGKELWLSLNATLERDVRFKPLKMTGGVLDVTRYIEPSLNYHCSLLSDSITNIPNRMLFYRELRRHCLNIKLKEKSGFALFYISFDSGVRIAKVYGKKLAEGALNCFIDKIFQSISPSDVLGKMGEGEFGLLLSQVKNPAKLSSLANEFYNKLSKPMMLSGKIIQAQISIGVKYVDHVGDNLLHSLEEDLRDAENAMYRAQYKPGKKIEIFSEETNSSAIRASVLATDFYPPLRLKSDALVYQPIYNMEKADYVGLESYVNYADPHLGFISPKKLVQILRQHSSQNEIIQELFSKFCFDLSQLSGIFSRKLWASFSLSIEQLSLPILQRSFVSICKKAGLSPQQIVLQLQEPEENGLILNLADVIGPYVKAGFGIGLDDFGTGSWSMNSLEKIPLRYLKIDMDLFQMTVGETENHLAFSNFLASYGQLKNIQIIIKGIEKEYQLKLIQNKGLQFIQGDFQMEAQSFEDLQIAFSRLWLKRPA